ncbi:hypothetical protein IWX81_002875 [Salinibacterium sp. CAN_S4]|uniref:hypothetical protein n=1 Tax=Salinibacterium sp. CAN_S4 TaxID=2787727 RepID=UPI0018F05024
MHFLSIREILVVARLRLALVALGPLRVAIDERGAHPGGIRTRLQHLDVVPLTQLLTDAALCVSGGLVFGTECDGRLVGAGDVAQLGLAPLRRLVDGGELGPCCDSLRVELRLQLTCFLEVAAGGSLGRGLSGLGR